MYTELGVSSADVAHRVLLLIDLKGAVVHKSDRLSSVGMSLSQEQSARRPVGMALMCCLRRRCHVPDPPLPAPVAQLAGSELLC